MKLGAFILTNGRPEKVKTIKALRNAGYTGDIKLICDDLDNTLPEYKEKYGEDIIVFDKREVLAECDTMDNFGRTNMVLPARNTCHKIAKELGWDYFFELDDDYNEFCIRMPKGGKLKAYKVKNLDALLAEMVNFLKMTGSLVICLSQAGDYIGGANGGYIKKGLSRKAMNCFLCDTNRPFKFMGTINEDVNMYVTRNMQGEKIFSITSVGCVQELTQQSSGGLTTVYLDLGTYVKSFYSVIAEPSCVRVALMGNRDRRLHHNVRWNNCAPKIISEKYKKM